MDLRRTCIGCALVYAALLDVVLGLVIARIIPGLTQAESEMVPAYSGRLSCTQYSSQSCLGLGLQLWQWGLERRLDYIGGTYGRGFRSLWVSAAVVLFLICLRPRRR
ncbi:hypothetical protein BDZ97DRAFT_1872654, partial [Flammula alnicola]